MQLIVITSLIQQEQKKSSSTSHSVVGYTVGANLASDAAAGAYII
jgi:hypothetical protein